MRGKQNFRNLPPEEIGRFFSSEKRGSERKREEIDKEKKNRAVAKFGSVANWGNWGQKSETLVKVVALDRLMGHIEKVV